MHVAHHTIRKYLPSVTLFNEVQKQQLLLIAEHCAAVTAAAGSSLPRQIGHCDANELNVVVDESGQEVSRKAGRRTQGMTMFSDGSSHCWTPLWWWYR